MLGPEDPTVDRDARLSEFVDDEESSDDDGDGAPASETGDAAPTFGEPDEERVSEEDEVASSERAPDVAGAAAATSDAERDGEAVAPTSSVTPDGAPCAACGSVVARRWRSDDGLVCADCREW